jgi:hypothetical protein
VKQCESCPEGHIMRFSVEHDNMSGSHDQVAAAL